MEDDSNEEVAPVGRLESFILSSCPTALGDISKPSVSEQRISLLEQKLEEQGQQINELRSENDALKKQLNEAFQNIITIYNKINKVNKLENYNTKLDQINLNFLYQNCTIFLDRKYNRYLEFCRLPEQSDRLLQGKNGED